jgi:ATP-dependent DNA ligase
VYHHCLSAQAVLTLVCCQLLLKSQQKPYQAAACALWGMPRRDYCEGLRDSLDLVPIGGWYGNGRKAGWVSPFLLASWDPETETLATVCRCMSGFTDVFYAEVSDGPCSGCGRPLVRSNMDAHLFAGRLHWHRNIRC